MECNTLLLSAVMLLFVNYVLLSTRISYSCMSHTKFEIVHAQHHTTRQAAATRMPITSYCLLHVHLPTVAIAQSTQDTGHTWCKYTAQNNSSIADSLIQSVHLDDIWSTTFSAFAGWNWIRLNCFASHSHCAVSWNHFPSKFCVKGSDWFPSEHITGHIVGHIAGHIAGQWLTNSPVL